MRPGLLYTEHKRAIYRLAHQVRTITGTHLDVDELVSVGSCGFMLAVQGYASERGASFFTYMWGVVRNEMLDAACCAYQRHREDLPPDVATYRTPETELRHKELIPSLTPAAQQVAELAILYAQSMVLEGRTMRIELRKALGELGWATETISKAFREITQALRNL